MEKAWRLHGGGDVLHTKRTDHFIREDRIPGTERSLCRCLDGCEIKLEDGTSALKTRVGFFSVDRKETYVGSMFG